ncbi:hypothetical protein ACFE04_024126 [Oxalis oulophora]
MSALVGVIVPQQCQCRHNNNNKRNMVYLSFFPTISLCSSSSNEDNKSPMPIPRQVGFDLSEELFGLGIDLNPSNNRNATSAMPKSRSWFGPNGQYIKELPCPSCRGRGYVPCADCEIERSRVDCPHCNGKGMMTCNQCLGDRVIWEESIDEKPWEKARSISPFKVKDDDEVDNIDIKLDVKKKSKRVYRSTSPEIGSKISRTLKSLNAKTGIFSNRMKIIHSDPALRAQRVAAIKKAKGTAAARKHTSETLKAFFSDPENRRKRSISMKGVNFFCGNCGREGHRKFYCPEFRDSPIDKRFRCRICGEKGHNKRSCSKSRLIYYKSSLKRHYRCSICRETGHDSRTCPQAAGKNVGKSKSLQTTESGIYKCRLCGEKGHNARTCHSKRQES